jgi:hypothetical protein
MSAAKIQKFCDAMQKVYGDTSNLRGEALENWIAPPSSGGHRGRYLWTDAFGVLNFLTLFKELNETKYLTLAKRLVESVHGVLGWTRDGKSRLPRATDENPLGGGLRIGKEEENGPDGDGQYHHYLTLWMFTLNRLSIASRDPSYNNYAISLAHAIHPYFFLGRTTSRPRMMWKISVDMEKPLFTGQGHLDAHTGYVVFRLLQETAEDHHVLDEEIEDYRKVISSTDSCSASNDTLDIGMALWIAHWCQGKEAWAEQLGQSGIRSLSMDSPFLVPNRKQLTEIKRVYFQRGEIHRAFVGTSSRFSGIRRYNGP